MTSSNSIVIAAAVLIAFLSAIWALLRGWSGWLALKQAEFTRHAPPPRASATPANRIAVADLKERVRRLEAIAAGDA